MDLSFGGTSFPTGDMLTNLGLSPQQQQQAAAPTSVSPTVNPTGIGGIGGGALSPTTPTTQTPATDPKNLGMSTDLGMNVGTGQLAVGGLSALGNLWTAWNATNLAKQSFSFNKQLASDNYANQATSYNTNLSDKLTARGVMENQSAGTVQSNIDANKLKTTV